MGKVHKTFRLDEELAEGVSDLKAEGESESAVYSRIIKAGLDALESGKQAEPREPTEGAAEACKEEDPSSLQALQAVIDAKNEHIASLEKQLQAQNEQVVAAINSLQTSNAAQVTGDIVTAKLIESTEAKKQGRWARAWAAFRGKDKEA